MTVSCMCVENVSCLCNVFAMCLQEPVLQGYLVEDSLCHFSIRSGLDALQLHKGEISHHGVSHLPLIPLAFSRVDTGFCLSSVSMLTPVSAFCLLWSVPFALATSLYVVA